MKMLSLRVFAALSLLCSLLSFSSHAQDAPNYGYLSLEPDIITNYIGPSAKKLGYVRVTVELMIDSVDVLDIAEHHLPLLRATAKKQSEGSCACVGGTPSGANTHAEDWPVAHS